MVNCWICEGAFQTKREHGLGVLPTFKGYTVDFRLRQFRWVEREEPYGGMVGFIDFDSPEGKKLCGELHEAAVEILNERMVA